MATLTRNLLLVLCVLLPAYTEAVQIHGRVLMVKADGTKVKATKVSVSAPQLALSKNTDDNGRYFLNLPTAFSAGNDLTLEVQKDGWVIHKPVGGSVVIPVDSTKQPVDILLLPKGSKLLWTEERIDQFVSEMVVKAKDQIKLSGKPTDTDFGPYIKDWASKLGFSLDEARHKIDEWAEEVEKNSQNFEKLGKAAFAKRDFAKAKTYFKQFADASFTRAAQKREQAKRIEKEYQDSMDDAIRASQAAGDAAYNNYDFAEALTEYQRAEGAVDRNTSPVVWAKIQFNLAQIHYELAVRSEGAAINDHFDKAIAAYHAALKIRTREALPQDWAATQNNLASALRAQGVRTNGDLGNALIARSVKSYAAALEVRTRDALPLDWASTQNNLANALSDQGKRTYGDASNALLAQSAEAYRSALEVLSRTVSPQNWAAIQNNLGIVLETQGDRALGRPDDTLLAQAVEAYREALKVYTREALPQDWASTQNNLAGALQSQGKNTSGEARAALLAQAVETYRETLKVYTREALPQNWAMTHNNLALALRAQSERTSGDAGNQLLTQAVDAYQEALKVYTREALPQNWAMTQNNLAIALRAQSERTSGEARTALLAQAVEATRGALELRTHADLPRQWAETQFNLALTLIVQDIGTNSTQIIKAIKAALSTTLSLKDGNAQLVANQLIVLLRELLESNGADVAELYIFGSSFIDYPDFHTDALKLLQRAVTIEPNNFYALDSLGWLHYKMKNYPAALQHLERAWEMKSTYVAQNNLSPTLKLASHLGEVLWATGDKDRAREVWRWALSQEDAADKGVVKEAMARLDP